MVKLITATLIMLTVPAFAQDTTPPNPSKPCFEVVSLASSAPTAAILVDRCTGQTWSLDLNSSPQGNEWAAAVTWEPIRRERYPGPLPAANGQR